MAVADKTMFLREKVADCEEEYISLQDAATKIKKKQKAAVKIKADKSIID
jgi:hypothetical protein